MWLREVVLGTWSIQSLWVAQLAVCCMCLYVRPKSTHSPAYWGHKVPLVGKIIMRIWNNKDPNWLASAVALLLDLCCTRFSYSFSSGGTQALWTTGLWINIPENINFSYSMTSDSRYWNQCIGLSVSIMHKNQGKLWSGGPWLEDNDLQTDSKTDTDSEVRYI